MKNNFYLLLILFSFPISNVVNAQLPSGFTNIDINNIDAGITSSNDLFWDFNTAKFEVPKGSGLHSIFAGGMWIGGLDNGGQTHLAAQTYRQTGTDYYPGPIDTVNNVPLPWSQWDNSWKINKTEVLDHIQNYTNSGYIVPPSIAQWPGYNASLGRVLAPFADYNSNGIYDPSNGDFPYILGDQSVYSIYNDMYPHTESGCTELGIEVHRTLFGFDAPSDTALNNSIFSRYEIKNYSSIPYNNIHITMWIDFDLGNASDDYVGTDMNLDMIYAYNADNLDETSAGYGLNPPAIGVYFLNDSLTGSLAYENINGLPTGNPGACNDFLYYTNSFWLDNQPVTYGGDGRNISNPITKHMYPGVTNSIYYSTLGDWTEATAGNPPNDRRMIGSIGPFTLNAGGYKSFDVGYTWARAGSGGPLASLTELQNAVSGLRLMYDSGLLTSLPTIEASLPVQLNIYPNPASGQVTIKNISTGNLFDVSISDAMGRLVYEINNIINNQHTLDTRNFSNGVYIVTVIQDNKTFHQKLVIK